VNDVAVGIALMLVSGTGLAFYLGKAPLIEPDRAATGPAIDFGWWSGHRRRSAAALRIKRPVPDRGGVLAPVLYWAFRTTRWGLLIRTAGESADAARAMGHFWVPADSGLARDHGRRLPRRQSAASFLSLSIPGAGTKGWSSGQGITAVALVDPSAGLLDPRCCACWSLRLAFGRRRGAWTCAAVRSAVTSGYHLFNAAALHPDACDRWNHHLFAKSAR